MEPERGIGPGEEQIKEVSRRRVGKKRIALGTFTGLVLVAGGAYTQKDKYADDLANLSRSVIGGNNTARVERVYFSVEDNIHRLKYNIFGGQRSPYGQYEPEATSTTQPSLYQEPDQIDSEPFIIVTPLPPEPPKPAPLILPQTKLLQPKPAEGEGIWITEGLPHSSPNDILMAKTYIRPDLARPDASVAILLLDKRRIRLHITGGTKSPGGDRGVSGPGRIPDTDRKDLLVAWNGGFQGPHARFGMYADGREYRPLINGFASVAVMRDGTILMGEWGRTLFWSNEMVAVRQNTALLVEDCKVSNRTLENNNTWGYIVVQSQENVTRRSAIGLTANGDLLVAAGTSVKPDTLARALKDAGACIAMQLDMNTPQTNTSLYFQELNGTISASNLAKWMTNPRRFLGTEDNDFMYATLDEKNFKP